VLKSARLVIIARAKEWVKVSFSPLSNNNSGNIKNDDYDYSRFVVLVITDAYAMHKVCTFLRDAFFCVHLLDKKGCLSDSFDFCVCPFRRLCANIFQIFSFPFHRARIANQKRARHECNDCNSF
jgi:hypothetical protein